MAHPAVTLPTPSTVAESGSLEGADHLEGLDVLQLAGGAAHSLGLRVLANQALWQEHHRKGRVSTEPLRVGGGQGSRSHRHRGLKMGPPNTQPFKTAGKEDRKQDHANICYQSHGRRHAHGAKLAGRAAGSRHGSKHGRSAAGRDGSQELKQLMLWPPVAKALRRDVVHPHSSWETYAEGRSDTGSRISMFGLGSGQTKPALC